MRFDSPNIRAIEKRPNRDAIAMLEESLAKAKAGEITGVVIVASHSDGCTSYAWGGINTNGKRIIGELAIAASAIARNYE